MNKIKRKLFDRQIGFMRQIRITILVIIAGTILCACPELDDECGYITVVNKSKQRIGFQPHLLTANLTHEDSLFQCDKSAFGVYPDTLRRLSAGMHSDWEKEMNGYSYLQILIIDAKTFDQYISAPCDTIRKYVPILHTYRLTLEDLERMNWTVVYSPEE